MTKTHHVVEIIAHRGASAYAPENTLASFSKAMLLGAHAVELDVQETKDHELVVIHDPNLKHIADDRRLLTNISYGELAHIDAGSWFNAMFQDERVPTLTQVLDLLNSTTRKMEIHLEIKDGKQPYPGIERRVMETLRHRPDWSGRIIVSSFNHPALRRVRELAPEMRLGYLVGATRFSTAMKEAVELRCESVHMSLRRVSAACAKAVHDAGMRLLVYTINTWENLDLMQGIGVDGVFSDYPDLRVNGSGKI